MNFKNKWLIGVVSAALIAATSRWEGTRYVPYRDVGDVWTVCEGYAGKDVVPGKTYTPAECKALLTTQLKSKGEEVLQCTTVPLNENQYDAFTLFAYNVGSEAFCKSSLLKKLNAGDYVGACNGLLAWDNVDGKPVAGLLARRRFERDWCVRPVTTEVTK
jgi:lysozyme